jgi:DNA gyrase/topoisomerase IV subunit A
MTQTDKCPRFGITESISHLLCECPHANNIWNEYNNFMIKVGQNRDCVNNYQSIYSTANSPATTLIKIKVIQEMIQIIRPKSWNKEKMEDLVRDLFTTENYIARKNHEIDKFHEKWSFTL